MKKITTKPSLLIDMFKELWFHINPSRRRQFYFLSFLMIFASLLEVISIGAILPFLGALTEPELIYQHPLMKPIIELTNITSPSQLLLPTTVIFIISAILAGSVRLLLLYSLTKLSFMTGADLSINIYRRTLYQNYEVHVGRNSSQVINGIISKTGTVISGIIAPMLTLISSLLMMIMTIYVLFIIDAKIAFSAISGFIFIYLVIVQLTKKKLKENSAIIAHKSSEMIKALQEGLGGIRDVLINGSQEFYSQLYRNADLPMRHAMASNTVINGSPRYLVESLGMVMVAILAYSMSLREQGLDLVIPVLGALALGAQRLLPALQQAYSSYATIRASHSSFEDVLKLLDQPMPSSIDNLNTQSLNFDSEIKLENLSFRYDVNSEWVLKDINLTINKGTRIGFIGETGCGKSTLLDIIMGLLPQTKGIFKVDEKVIDEINRSSWQEHIAHVPQNIYLSDSSIEENIAFGVAKKNIDQKQLKKAASQAQISDLIESWSEGYNTFIGEQGARLSGGQRQRLGIARALYKNADILIFDEATSALDSSTEKSVMKSIESLDRNITILIIAHRLSTLDGCDQIIELKNTGIFEIKG